MKILAVHPSSLMYTKVFLRLEPLGIELIAAALRQASATYSDERAFLVRAGKELAVLLVNDVNRLNGILRRIRR